MKIPDDPFGIKVVVGSGVELVKARWLPVLAAKGEARAELVRVRGEFEVRKLENQIRVIEEAEARLRGREVEIVPVDEDVLYSVLEESGRTSDVELQKLWSELLAGAATEGSNRIACFTSIAILRQLSPLDAQTIQQLVKLVPETYIKTDVTCYYFNTGWTSNMIKNESEFGNVSCSGDHNQQENDKRTPFENTWMFANWDENARFTFALRNIERLGLVFRSRKRVFPVSAIIEEFTFSLIGQSFLNSVGLHPGVNCSFTDLELLDSMKK